METICGYLRSLVSLRNRKVLAFTGKWPWAISGIWKKKKSKSQGRWKREETDEGIKKLKKEKEKAGESKSRNRKILQI